MSGDKIPKEIISGFDKYLDFRYGEIDSFYKKLFEAIEEADKKLQMFRLAIGFPGEVVAYLCWNEHGVECFVEKISENHPFRTQLVVEYNLDQLEKEK